VTTARNGGTAPASASAQLAALGPFFAVGFHAADGKPSGDWRPMRGLLDDPAVLDGRVAAVRAFLAAGTAQDPDAVELRVAASVVHLGLVARIIAPMFGLTLLQGQAPALFVRDLRWQPTLGGMFPLSLPSSSPDPAPTILDGAVAELSPLAARFGVSAHILRGNVASAIGGAATAATTTRPDLADAARALLADLLGHPLIAGSAHLEPAGTLRRHSCCLIYRAAPDRDGGLCGDCALAPRRGKRRT
jgi:hypothetical protein